MTRAPVIEATLAATAVSTTCRVTAGGRPAVLRVDGPGAAQLELDRSAEARVLAAVSAAGLGPKCLASDPVAGTLLTEWLPGRALAAADLREPGNLARAASLLREVHGLPVAGPVLDLPAAIDRYARLAGPGSADLAGATRAALAGCLRDALPPLRLCHNDPTPGNFIAGADGRLRLIDWEYAGLGYPAFDLAGLATGADFDRAADERLLRAYLGRPATPSELERHARWRHLAALVGELWGRGLAFGNQ